ncbi:MAG: PEGA domain-containing protein [Methanoregulaceae archaeon]|nr:PEGA domain-containing protein [Methanoregulaceae archaeon]
MKNRIFFVISVVILCAAVAGTASAMIITLPETPIGGDMGYFSIQSNPGGADVNFDGSYQGETPVMVSVYSTARPSHTITIMRPGYQTWTRTYNQNPPAGETITVMADLVPSQQSGNIYVSSSPSGATAVLDGSDTQSTPCSFSGVSPGTHSLAVNYPGYRTYYSSPYVTAGKTTQVNAVLSPIVSTGSLYVSSSPNGASLYVDGVYYGHTPATVGNFDAGNHNVRLQLGGYQDWTGSVYIAAGSTASLTPTLTRIPQPTSGSISITTSPTGAQVYVDGSYQGITSPGQSVDVYNDVPGSHVVEISEVGYQDSTTTVTVSAGSTTPVSIALTQNPKPSASGAISVISSPSAAEVYLDNAYRGYSPLTLDSVSPGSHTLLLKLGGYQDWSSTLQVNAGQTTSVSPTLIPAATPEPTRSGGAPLAVFGGIAIAGLYLAFRRKTL